MADLGALLVISLLVGCYLLPTVIGSARHAPDLWAVALINIALGWTVGGWIVALVMAMRSPPPPAQPITIINQPAAPPVILPPPAGPHEPPPPPGTGHG